MHLRNVVFLVVLAHAAGELAADQPKPVKKIALQDLPAYKEAAESDSARPTKLVVSFLDENEIVIFVEFEFQPRHESDDSISLENAHHNAAVLALNAASLAGEKSRVWKDLPGLPPVQPGLPIRPTGNSGCLLLLDNKLFSLSRMLEVSATRALPPNSSMHNGFMRQDQWQMLTEPQWHKALLVRFPFVSADTRKYGEAHWISPQTLEDELSVTVPRWEGEAVLVHNSILFNELNALNQPVQIQTNSEQPRPLCAECFGNAQASFGNGLVFLRGVNKYSVRDATGAYVFGKSGVGGRADRIDGIRGATVANRVAYHVGHLGGSAAKETVVVVDAQAKKEIWRYELQLKSVTTKIDGFVKESLLGITLALSPDGKKLAVVDGDTFSLFDIP